MNKWGKEIKPNKPWNGMGRFTVKKFWQLVSQNRVDPFHCSACNAPTFPSHVKSHVCKKCFRDRPVDKECRWCGFKKDFPGVCSKCNLSSGKWSIKRAESFYGSPCLICQDVPVFRTLKSDPCVCKSCRNELEQDFNNRKADREERIRLRGLRKQMADVGQLIRQARKLINENNEPTARYSLRRNRQSS